jgi:hypothetical protein
MVNSAQWVCFRARAARTRGGAAIHTALPNGKAAIRTTIALLVAVLAVTADVRLVPAQAMLRGRVIDSEVGQPLQDATVRVKGLSNPLVTDSLGRFQTTELPAGPTEVRIQLLGYALGIFSVHLPASGSLEKDFSLDFTGNKLPEQVVRARAERLVPRYMDFEQRRARKLGAYFRWDELEARGYSSVGDALRTVRGVRIKCNQQTFECFAFMARSPQCQPVWWIDGVEVRSFHENTPIRDVYGIEIYRGAGEVPGEYTGSNAACGVIVIWTKSRPFK